MDGKIVRKVRNEARIWSVILVIVSIGMIFLSWKMQNSGIVILYSAVSILIVSIHTWRSYKAGVKMEKMIYMIGLMVVVIFFFASLAQLK
ncbi:MAG: hypothetical protein LBM95_02915 [Lactobacillales bacterium]|jgi:membrane-bound ClpP family serine protease|uniref:hypothetical protein n=1 Tax=Enterococcus larvae TaxID=2794352 RepID=UPI002824A7B9|nr:hypothetical protein [Lactobacillales bacterium]